jgi:hypothetical protein
MERKGEPSSGTFTWSTIVAQLWGQTPFGALDTTNASFPTHHPENLSFMSTRVWDALEKICETINHHLILKADGTFALVSGGNADSDSVTKKSTFSAYMIRGGNNTTPLAPYIPENFRVYFPARKWQFQYGSDILEPTYMDYWRNNAVVYKTVSAATAGFSGATYSGTTHVLYGSRSAVYDEAGTWTNEANCATDATTIATNYVNRYQEAARFKATYKTAADFNPGAKVAAVSWFDTGSGVRTQIFHDQSHNQHPVLKGSGGAASDIDHIPSLSRESIPFERLAVVRLLTDIAPLGSGTVRVQWATGTPPTWSDTALPHEITVWDITGSSHPADARRIAQWNQQWHQWQLLSSTGDSIVRFRLTADLDLGGNAEARILTWNSATNVYDVSADIIMVYDWFNTIPTPVRTGMFRGEITYEGWCVFREALDPEVTNDRDKYDIVWMENKADWITFELRAKITNQDEPTLALYSVTIGSASHSFSRGRDPNPNGQDFIFVYDVTGTFLHAPVGAIGFAKYNDRNDHYEVVRCQMPMIRGMGTLVQDLCADDAVFNWEQGVLHGEHMLTPDPVPSTAVNPCLHRGQSGDIVLIEYDGLTDEWRVYDVTKKVRSFVTNVSWLSDTGCIAQTKQSIAVEFCEEDVSSDIVVCFAECPPIPE